MKPKKTANEKKKRRRLDNKVGVFVLGFILGALPVLLGYIYTDPNLSIWSVVTGLMLGLLSLIVQWLFLKNKIVGLGLLIILIFFYVVFLSAFFGILFGGLY